MLGLLGSGRQKYFRNPNRNPDCLFTIWQKHSTVFNTYSLGSLQYLQTFVMLKLKFRQRLSLSIQLNQTTQLLGPSCHWQCFFFSLLLFYSHDFRCVDETLMTGHNLCMNDAFSLCSTSAQLDYILCNTH